ncbi:fucose-1-phosphate guanylyltransferase-like isoform X2 [Acanthaster planci]|nr:fucose-1-phosphate guanylyltransferase-like isoform X2 [Acanthaster planci]XP_022084454.1 fucose-1-phosphate guanylyltransferase-like isoform X2 [Acanthaster planci]
MLFWLCFVTTDKARCSEIQPWRRLKQSSAIASELPLSREFKNMSNSKVKKVGDFPFWDIVVISSMDTSQKLAYELQLQEKLDNEELPLGVDYYVIADPGTEKIGGGGSMMASLQCLRETYQKDLETKKVLIMPAGGYSQRLPNASLLGKMFLSIPLGDPFYTMFDLKLALSIDFPAKMSAGVFLGVSDCIELYVDEDSPNWSFDERGVTALGHPSPISIGTGHGVFVVPTRQANSPSVEVVAVEEFLHKPTVEIMQEKGAVLGNDFCSGIGSEEKMVLTDSCYYMDFTTAMKLLELYNDESPLRCEIDCHGDFLQPLGLRATSEYIKNTSNVTKVTDSLMSMRQKVFDVLKGTPLSVAVMQHSRFYHLGTINEYLDHMCNLTPLAKELGLGTHMYKPDGPDDGTCTSGTSRIQASGKCTASACVMNSICPKGFQVEERSLVEYCDFQMPVSIHSNSIVSSCCVGSTPDQKLVTVPKDTFLHTACISDGKAKRQFVTVAFGTQDNLKKEASIEELSMFGKPFKDICGTDLDMASKCLFPDGTTQSLWHAKLFRPADKMEDSFSSTMSLMERVLSESPLQPSLSEWEGCLSMADLIQSKDIFKMLEFRRELRKKMQLSTNN